MHETVGHRRGGERRNSKHLYIVLAGRNVRPWQTRKREECIRTDGRLLRSLGDLKHTYRKYNKTKFVLHTCTSATFLSL